MTIGDIFGALSLFYRLITEDSYLLCRTYDELLAVIACYEGIYSFPKMSELLKNIRIDPDKAERHCQLFKGFPLHYNPDYGLGIGYTGTEIPFTEVAHIFESYDETTAVVETASDDELEAFVSNPV